MILGEESPFKLFLRNASASTTPSSPCPGEGDSLISDRSGNFLHLLVGVSVGNRERCPDPNVQAKLTMKQLQRTRRFATLMNSQQAIT